MSATSLHLEEDRISTLPDGVLSHILSFMPTKSAVKTSILCKRWEHVWTMTPVIDFSECQGIQITKRQKKLFLGFVNRVLSRNQVSSLRYFRFDFFQGMEEGYMDQLISAVMWRSIDEVDLCSYMSLNVSAESFRKLFSSISSNLVVLKLEGGFVINVPDSINFPSLEMLHLVHTIFGDSDSADILISGCPLLRELRIDDCVGVKKLVIDRSSLKELEISLLNLRDAVVAAPNLKRLYLKHTNDKMLIETYARVNNKDRREFIIRQLLKSLDSEGLPLPSTNSLEANVSRYLRTFHRSTTFQRVVGDNQSMFSNLTTLKIDSYMSKDVFYVLGHTPRLKSLTAYNLPNDVAKESTYIHQTPTPLPNCLSACLETVDLHFVNGSYDYEYMKATEYLLRNGTELKEMKIHMDHFNPEKETSMLERLSKLPKASGAVEITMYLCWPRTASQSAFKYALTDQGLQLSFDELRRAPGFVSY